MKKIIKYNVIVNKKCKLFRIIYLSIIIWVFLRGTTGGPRMILSIVQDCALSALYFKNGLRYENILKQKL